MYMYDNTPYTSVELGKGMVFRTWTFYYQTWCFIWPQTSWYTL